MALINKENLIKSLRFPCGLNEDGILYVPLKDVIKSIENSPEIDGKARPNGEWVGYPECLKYPNAYADDHIVCSVCEECFSILDNDCERFYFCPHCGAEMKGEN